MTQARLGVVRDMGPWDNDRVLVLYIRTSDPDAIKALSPGNIKITPKRGRGRPRKKVKK